MFDLKKYDGRYVEILYGQTQIIGKLYVDEKVIVKNALLNKNGFSGPHKYIRYYISKVSGEAKHELNRRYYNELQVNERSIDALKDITEEIYRVIPSIKKNLEKKKEEQSIKRLGQLEKDIEQIREAKKKEEKPKRRLSFIYSP